MSARRESGELGSGWHAVWQMGRGGRTEPLGVFKTLSAVGCDVRHASVAGSMPVLR